MIAHVSLPARDCAQVARVLADMLRGGALRFPPGGPDAWNCWSEDNAFQIVVTPRSQFIVAGPAEQVWVLRPQASRDEPAYESHFAMAVPRRADEIIALARAAGWRARTCNRGGMFDVVEVWVENVYLVEALDPAQMNDYRRSMTVEHWTRAFAL